jgi:dTDP-4-amino-4,6-dideoxygalactose transaminase
VYSVLLRPALYGITRVLPLGLGRTPYETDYPIAHFSSVLAGLGLRQAVRLTQINAARIANAARLRAALEGVRGLTLPRIPAQAAPVYARFPLRVNDPARRDAFVAALEADGIGATRSYPEALVDVPEVAARLPTDNPAQPGARLVARTIVTLPTHAYCPPELATRVRRIAESVLA